MRTLVLVAAALGALAAPAFAQDRTLPAGAYTSSQPAIDTLGYDSPASSPTVEGRSVGANAVRVVRVPAHHRN